MDEIKSILFIIILLGSFIASIVILIKLIFKKSDKNYTPSNQNKFNEKYHYASLWDRINSNFWDYLIIYVLILILSFIIRREENFNPVALTIGFYPFYNLFFIKGRTLGKRIQGIQIVNKNGVEIGYIKSFIRAFLITIFISTVILLVVTLIYYKFSKKEQMLHDLILKTFVIDIKPYEVYS